MMMRLGFFRKQNTELPLFNGRRDGSRSSSPQRTRSRRNIIIGLVVFLVVILLFGSTGSSKPKRAEPKNRFDRYYNAREDLFNTRLFFIKSVASVCTNLDKNSTFWPQSAGRYLSLGMDENSSTQHKYFFAIMLHDSAIHLPTLIDNLLRVIYHLGEQNVFLSIYESPSGDKGHTTAMIETIKIAMDSIGIETEVQIQEGEEGHAPNAVLEPLKAMFRDNRRLFNTVVMMNDDLWCAEELLELLFHSRGQAASITCSTDVRSTANVFSLSPGHDVNGRLFRQGKIGSYLQDEFSASRFRDNYPLRVQSCFSSVTLLDPTPFYPPFDFSFAYPDVRGDHPSSTWEGKCGFSAELDMAVRFAAAGFDRAMIIPRSQTAGNLLEFFKLHRTQEELEEREALHRQLGLWEEVDTGGRENPFAKDYKPSENEIIWELSSRVADRFECTVGNRMEWQKLALPVKMEKTLQIDRKLPDLS